MGWHIGYLLAAEPVRSVLPFSRCTAAIEEAENSERGRDKRPR